ncbi:MAG: insulinase family protein [Novosphingobium sp.]|nr:insulinase family protein [Novosphingobium sp.]
MRYAIRANATPKGTATVRMEVSAASLDESEAERGFAHFVEHMAFNGSTNVPEGEMVKLLEREGLAFGADTNASTSFSETNYRLDLPRNDPALLDLALMLMRETASELTFSPGAVEREKGVVLAEMRDRNTYAMREYEDSTDFRYPHSLYARRLPIGTAETLNAATAQGLKAFWQREYVPGHTTVVVIGDFDPAMVEAKIRERFADWQGPNPEPQPDAGPVDFADKGRTDIYIDPALPERTEVTRNGLWLGGTDTVARRQENLLRQIGYNAINRRLLSTSRQASPPFRGAGFGTGDVFETARTTRLIVDTSDRKWREGLIAATIEYRRALKYGFTETEIAEQVADVRTQMRNAAEAADTRTHAALAQSVWALVRDGTVPSEPHTVLDRFEALAPQITPKSVLAALKREAVPLDDPLLRFRGRYDPEGGTEALRQAWNEAVRTKITKGDSRAASLFAYTHFGEPGTIASDVTQPELGIRKLRFANGVMLNLKRTDLNKGQVLVKLSIDGGQMLDRKETPFATELVRYLAEGGLEAHSEDELQSLLAGHTVANEFRTDEAATVATARTTPEDLTLQLQVLAAYVTAPGHRGEGVERYRQDINRYFAQAMATPGGALSHRIGAIVSDEDPRFSVQDVEKYRALTFDALADGVGERMKNGAIEIGLVGDFDEQAAVAAVAATFGALPPREAAFRSYADEPRRTFTANRERRVLRHTGQADQALIRYAWPTRDDADPVAALSLELLERVTRVSLTDELREALGKAYSPGASSRLSRYWQGYGTFEVTASVAVSEVKATEVAIRETLDRLRSAPVDADLLQRARQPMLESLHNALKSNGGWLGLVDRAQGEAERIDRYLAAEHRLLALTANDVLAAAKQYLDPDQALEIVVLPEGIDPPK